MNRRRDEREKKEEWHRNCHHYVAEHLCINKSVILVEFRTNEESLPPTVNVKSIIVDIASAQYTRRLHILHGKKIAY